MSRKCLWLVFVSLFLIPVPSIDGQIRNNAKTPDEEVCRIDPPRQMSPEEEVRYRSPVRYVVVYDNVDDLGIRRIEMLLDEKCFNEQALRTIFAALGRRYPTPIGLDIEVHTSLDTIETPEERLMWKDSEGSRFADVVRKHHKASFWRFENGREAFIYTESITPYKTKLVVIKE